MSNPDLETDLDLSPLLELPRALHSHGYSEEGVSKLLGLWDISELNGSSYASYCWKCRPNQSALSQLIQVFLLGLPTTRERLGKLIDSNLIDTLMKLGLLYVENGFLSSGCAIYPCLGRFIVTDHWVTSGAQADGKVYELGTDSYVLARVTPRKGGSALDLCTGSGVHAVGSAAVCSKSTAVDINPRALLFTQVNAAIAGVEIDVALGDLYQPNAGQTFDLITANPPFVPSPDSKVLIHRSAGVTGEEVPERLVAGLPQALKVQGLFSMVLEHPVFSSETYLNRLERWLGEERGWGIAVLTFREYDVPSYALRHLGGVDDPEATFNDYLRSYGEVGITAMRFANVFITRLPYDAPNWKVELQSPWPNIDISDQVQEWLEAQTEFGAPDWKPDDDWVPSLSRRFTDLYVSSRTGEGFLQKSELTWLEPPALSPNEVELLKSLLKLGGRVRDLRARWPHGQATFEAALRGLGLARALARN